MTLRTPAPLPEPTVPGTTSEAADIVERLRKYNRTSGYTSTMQEAADTIEAMRLADKGRRAEVAVLKDDIIALRARVAELEQDAARYRWLRDGCCDKDTAASRIAQNEYGMHWDAAIDAARKE